MAIEDFDFEAAASSIGDDLGFGGGGDDNELPDNGDVNLEVDDTGNGEGNKGTPPPAPAADADTPPADTDATAQPPAPPQPAVEPPKTWRKEAAAEWAKLPPTVRQEVLKREQDMFAGLEAYKADATFGRGLKSVLDPYMPVLQQHGIDPAQQVAGLMQAHHTLALGTPEQKQALFQKLAQDYGVDLGALSGEPSYTDPEVARLRQQVQELQSAHQTRQQREAAVQREALQSQVDAFFADAKNVYAQELTNDMAQLIERGVCKTLQEAYDKAIWLNPAVRAKETERLNKEALEKKAKEDAARVEAAKKSAAANVRTKAKPSSGTAATGSMDDTLAETLRNIKSRGD